MKLSRRFVAATLLLVSVGAHAQYYPPPESAGGWRRLVSANSTPSAQQKSDIRSTVGLDWDLLKQAWDASSQYGGTFLVIRNGWIAAEWGTTATRIGVASCTKTFTSLAMHRMFQLGASGNLAYPIAPNDLAYLYLPPSWGSNATRRTIELRHLLTMSSGLEPDDAPPSPGGSTAAYEQKLLAPPVRTNPEREWSYASLPVDTLSLVTEYVTGQTLGSFFQQQIGAKIGVTTLQWAAFGTHTYASAYSMITGRDMARIAYLMLRDGAWNSTPIVSAQRIDSMTHWAPFLDNTLYGPQIKFPTDPESQQRYGWLVWTNRTQSPYVGPGVPTDAYYCAGFRTNFAMVIPSLDLIIVRLQSGPEPWDDAVFTAITSKVLSAIVDGSANVAPTAQITSPAEDESYHAPVSITVLANASDSDGSVTQVAFYAGATLLGTDTTAPFAFNWNDVPEGDYALTVRATVNDGAVTISTAVNIEVEGETNLAPIAQLTNPSAGASFTAPASIGIAAAASDSDGSVTKVSFYANDNLLGTDTIAPYSFIWSNVAAGNYTLTVRATDDDDAVASSSAVNITVQTAGGGNSTAIRINAGGPSYTDSLGQVWVADAGYYNTGTAKSSTSAIAATVNDPLYQKWRWDPDTDPVMTYSVPVPNGSYEVRLHFAEMESGKFVVGARVFDVQIEGATVLSNFDIFAQAGSRTALMRSVNTIVADSQLTITFRNKATQALISAIEIIGPAKP